MINRSDHIDALKILGAYAADMTPNPDDAVLMAHAEYTNRYPNWTGDDWVTAAHELSKQPRERMVQPADLGAVVKEIRRDRYQRADPETRDNPWRDLGGQPSGARYVDPDGGYIDVKGVRRDRYGHVDKSAPELEYDPDTNTEQRLDSYWRHVRDQAEPEYAGLKIRPASTDVREATMRQIVTTLGHLPDEDLPRINPLLVACKFCGVSKGQPCRTPGIGKMRRSIGHPSRITEAAVAAGYPETQAQQISDKIHTASIRAYQNAQEPRK